jgi:hypothetical protein
MTGKGRAGPIESLQRSGPVDSRVLTGPGAAKAGSEDEHAGVVLEGTRVDEGGAAASVGTEPGQGDRRLQIIDHAMFAAPPSHRGRTPVRIRRPVLAGSAYGTHAG